MFLIGRHLVGGQLSANLRGRGRLAAGLLNRVDRGIDQLDVGTLRSVRRVFPSLNKTLVLELARSEYVARRENVIALGNSGTGKTHIALGLGLAACQKGIPVGFTTAAALVNELHEARDEKRLYPTRSILPPVLPRYLSYAQSRGGVRKLRGSIGVPSQG